MTQEQEEPQEAEVGQMICPKCKGENIEPRGKMWYCRDCKDYFEHALTKAPPTE